MIGFYAKKNIKDNVERLLGKFKRSVEPYIFRDTIWSPHQWLKFT